MNAEAFLDTNILLYPYDSSSEEKGRICSELYERYSCCTSVQALNEFCHVNTKKWKQEEAVIARAVQEIRDVCQIGMTSLNTLYMALSLHFRYKYAYFDCLMLASALEYGCKYFISEDMAAGQVIEKRLLIINPFT